MALTKITPRVIESGLQNQGFKNKIIGGDFTTNPWQRGESFAAVSSGAYTADRWRLSSNTSAVVSVFKTVDSPSAILSGVYSRHCFHIDVTTADATIAAAEQLSIVQAIEGINSASLGFGQLGTRYVTLSFWHNHTKTGIHCVSLINFDLNRSYVAEYTQNLSNTWEKSEITIPVDTSGTWLYDNGVGVYVRFAVAAGTDFHGVANTWNSANDIATVNQVNNLDNVANNFKIALVQLEAGEFASDFESRSAGQEIELCERYYQVYNQLYFQYNDGVARASLQTYPLRTKMRAIPTLTGTVLAGSPALAALDVDCIRVNGTTTAGGQIGYNNVTANSEL